MHPAATHLQRGFDHAGLALEHLRSRAPGDEFRISLDVVYQGEHLLRRKRHQRAATDPTQCSAGTAKQIKKTADLQEYEQNADRGQIPGENAP